jgi:hypothetical protein
MWAGAEGSGISDATSANIIDKYLEAEQTHATELRGASMDVDIDASVPQLKEQGRLHALRCISKVGAVSYHVIAFKGDNNVKKQVIARYLDAERQAQAEQNLEIVPANYKFKFKGTRVAPTDRQVYVFEVSPRQKRVGLFKGEMWLDANTYLPVYEKGRLVKNPSIFFKKVEFERAYSVDTGVAVPVRTASVIKTRLVGEVQLNVSYSNFAPAETAGAQNTPASVGPDSTGSSASVQSSVGPYALRE